MKAWKKFKEKSGYKDEKAEKRLEFKKKKTLKDKLRNKYANRMRREDDYGSSY
ncbi:MAG: hypothetical protein WC346_10015 [Methanogenium sp.]|jgi:hypothetical protein